MILIKLNKKALNEYPPIKGISRKDNECHFLTAIQTLSYLPNIHIILQRSNSKLAKIFFDVLYSERKDIKPLVNHLSSLKIKGTGYKDLKTEVYQPKDYFDDLNLLLKAFKSEGDNEILNFFSANTTEIYYEYSAKQDHFFHKIESKIEKGAFFFSSKNSVTDFSVHYSTRSGGEEVIDLSSDSELLVQKIEEDPSVSLKITTPSSPFIIIKTQLDNNPVPLIFESENLRWKLFSVIIFAHGKDLTYGGGNHFYLIVYDLHKNKYVLINDLSVTYIEDDDLQRQLQHYSKKKFVSSLVYQKIGLGDLVFRKVHPNDLQMWHVENLMAHLPWISTIAKNIQPDKDQGSDKNSLKMIFENIYKDRHFTYNYANDLSFTGKLNLVLKTLWLTKEEKKKYQALALPFLLREKDDEDKEKENFVMFDYSKERYFNQARFFFNSAISFGQFICIEYPQVKLLTLGFLVKDLVVQRPNKRSEAQYELVGLILGPKIRSLIKETHSGEWYLYDSKLIEPLKIFYPETIIFNKKMNYNIQCVIYSLIDSRTITPNEKDITIRKILSIEDILKRKQEFTPILLTCFMAIAAIYGLTKVALFSKSVIVRYLYLIFSTDSSILKEINNFLKSRLSSTSTVTLTMKSIFEVIISENDTKIVDHFLSRKVGIKYTNKTEPKLTLDVKERMYGEVSPTLNGIKGEILKDGGINLDIISPLTNFFFVSCENGEELDVNIEISQREFTLKCVIGTTKSNEYIVHLYDGSLFKWVYFDSMSAYDINKDDNAEPDSKKLKDLSSQCSSVFLVYQFSKQKDLNLKRDEYPQTAEGYLNAIKESLNILPYCEVLEKTSLDLKGKSIGDMLEMFWNSSNPTEKLFSLQFLSIWEKKEIFVHKINLNYLLVDVGRKKVHDYKEKIGPRTINDYLTCREYLNNENLVTGNYLCFETFQIKDRMEVLKPKLLVFTREMYDDFMPYFEIKNQGYIKKYQLISVCGKMIHEKDGYYTFKLDEFNMTYQSKRNGEDLKNEELTAMYSNGGFTQIFFIYRLISLLPA